MTNFIPIFPLGIVVFPGEDLNLHIFEERYKQLIRDCFENDKPFGIPTVIGDKVMDHGTLVKVTEIVQVYDDGKMDIKTRGQEVFRLLETIREVPEKLYSGAIVTYPENLLQTSKPIMERILTGIRELHRLLNITKHFKRPDDQLNSYDVAHHAGLNLEEEFELLQLMREDHRLEYIRLHLSKVLPVIATMDELKERVKLNGHFKDLKAFDI